MSALKCTELHPKIEKHTYMHRTDTEEWAVSNSKDPYVSLEHWIQSLFLNLFELGF